MKCDKIRIELVEYSRGALSDAAAKRVSDHLQLCDGCRAFLEEETAFDGMLRSFLKESPSPDVWDSIQYKLHAQQQTWTSRLRAALQTNWAKTAGAVAVGTALILAIALQFDNSKPAGSPDYAVTPDMHPVISTSVKWTDDPASASSDIILRCIESM